MKSNTTSRNEESDTKYIREDIFKNKIAELENKDLYKMLIFYYYENIVRNQN